MQFIKRYWLWTALIILAAGAIGYYEMYSGKMETQYSSAPADRGTIKAVVDATGTINAVTSVQVGAQVSGIIAKLNVDFNSRVKKGDIIAQIDPSIFEGNLLQAQADLENARANLASAKANLEHAKANAIQSRADFNRTAALAKEGVLSQQQFDLAKATADANDAQVVSNEAQIKQAAAQADMKQASLEVAQRNLDYCTITAPIDGTVVNRQVDVGQTVASSLQTPTLFQIAQDLTKMQVYTKTDESDVGRLKVGQEVTFKVDAFPTETFHGKLSQVRMNATTVQNVVTYDTIVDFDNPGMKLFPGMTAYVTIPVGTAENTLRVTNGALRYKPDLKADEIKSLYQKYGIETGKTKNTLSQSEISGITTNDIAKVNPKTGAGEQKVQSNGNTASAMSGNEEKRTQSTVIWVLQLDKTLKPVKIKTGITDFTFTEVVSGDLKEGDPVVTSAKQVRGSMLPGLGGGARPVGR